MVDINFQCIEVTYGHTVKWQLNTRPAHANMLTDTHEYMHTIVLFVIFDCQPTLFNRLMRPRRPKLSKILRLQRPVEDVEIDEEQDFQR